ncbi:MAG: hypothetical protein ACD_79C01216G0004, partial [uncultured bacterium]
IEKIMKKIGVPYEIKKAATLRINLMAASA